jgi:hypothetical protein
VRKPDARDEVRDIAWWTYCILSARDAESLSGRLEGVEPGTDVELVAEGSLAALLSAVPLAEYRDDRLREHLEDLEWVERVARRHEAVLEDTLASATIVPLRLCTLYRDRDGLRSLLREQAAAFAEALERVDGCTEWGVKVFANPRAGRGAPTAAQDSPTARPERSGAAYLAQRQHERELAEHASEARGRCIEAVHRGISELARAARTNPPQRPEAHGRELMMLLNGAYLVERGREGELRDAVSALQRQWEPDGFVIELTGPWPAYNFVAGPAGMMP